MKVNGPVYVKSDKTSDIQDKNLSADEIETIIEDSVVSDGDSNMEEMKYYIHKKNSNKGESYVEVEVNSDEEDNLRETTNASHITQL